MELISSSLLLLRALLMMSLETQMALPLQAPQVWVSIDLEQQTLSVRATLTYTVKDPEKCEQAKESLSRNLNKGPIGGEENPIGMAILKRKIKEKNGELRVRFRLKYERESELFDKMGITREANAYRIYPLPAESILEGNGKYVSGPDEHYSWPLNKRVLQMTCQLKAP